METLLNTWELKSDFNSQVFKRVSIQLDAVNFDFNSQVFKRVSIQLDAVNFDFNSQVFKRVSIQLVAAVVHKVTFLLYYGC
jgi:hypothetical protein